MQATAGWPLSLALVLLLGACREAGWPHPPGEPSPAPGLRYRIDMDADPPRIQRLSDQAAVVTGRLLREGAAEPLTWGYTLTVTAAGGPATGGAEQGWPELTGRGRARFADNSEPKVVQAAGRTLLRLSLLGLLRGDDPDPALGSAAHRDSTTALELELKLSHRLVMRDLRFALTDIDAALTGGPCASGRPAEPDQPLCGHAFIDRVTLLDDDGKFLAQPVDPSRVLVLGREIRARFPDGDDDARPDSLFDGRLAEGQRSGDVSVTHLGRLDRLRLRLDDPGWGLEADPDGRHDFDAPWQRIGLASGLSFGLEQLPPPASATPDPDLTAVEGMVYRDVDGDGKRGDGEAGLEQAQIELFDVGDPREPRLVMTATVGAEPTAAGRFRLAGVRAGTAYRLEAKVPVPPAPSGEALRELRLLRYLDLGREGATIDIAVAAVEVAADGNLVTDGSGGRPTAPAGAAPAAVSGEDETLRRDPSWLLPDLVPLTQYELGDDVPAAMRDDVERSYPGMEAWTLDRASKPGRTLLRFGTMAANLGRGPLHVVGGADEGGRRPVYQRVYRADGSYLQRLVNDFVFHDGHAHTHVDRFEVYRLLDRATGRERASQPKVSFCLTDVLWSVARGLSQAAAVATIPMGWTCGPVEQSINVGFSDYYGPALPDQWIDVTGLPDGDYWLEVEVDPEDKLVEADEGNNKVRVALRLEAGTAR